MCTLIALHRCVAGAPLVIAANRDEFLERPSEGPALRDGPGGRIVAPRDGRAGGTWLGLNGTGVFAAVTNRHCSEPDPDCRSRGLLVTDALRFATAREAARDLEGLEDGAYNPFNLLVADREDAFLVTYDGSARQIVLQPGAHVVGNTDPQAPRSPKLSALDRAVAVAAAAAPERVLDELAAICRGHGGNGDVLGDACVHAGEYGTRSSTLLCLADDHDDSVFRYADGAPCGNAYRDYTPLLRDLRRDPGYVHGETATRSVN
ncbi:MAG: NRDE family protein [Myxococcota bacterium]